MFTGRIAALFGAVGLIVGAIVGPTLENFLSIDREIGKEINRLQLDGIESFLEGKATGDTHRINKGQTFIAVYGKLDLIESMRGWMVYEQETFNNVDTCNEKDRSLSAYSQMRKSVAARSRLPLGGVQLENVPPKLLFEVATRCLFAS